MFLQCSSNKSGMAIIIFYTLCLLYVLSTATFVTDIVFSALQVSNNPICKNIKFFISCAVAYQYTIVSTSNRLTANLNSPFDFQSRYNWLFWLHCPMYPGMHEPLCWYIIRFILQRSTDVGLCGVKISVLWSFRHSWQSHTWVSQSHWGYLW